MSSTARATLRHVMKTTAAQRKVPKEVPNEAPREAQPTDRVRRTSSVKPPQRAPTTKHLHRTTHVHRAPRRTRTLRGVYRTTRVCRTLQPVRTRRRARSRMRLRPELAISPRRNNTRLGSLAREEVPADRTAAVHVATGHTARSNTFAGRSLASAKALWCKTPGRLSFSPRFRKVFFSLAACRISSW